MPRTGACLALSKADRIEVKLPLASTRAEQTRTQSLLEAAHYLADSPVSGNARLDQYGPPSTGRPDLLRVLDRFRRAHTLVKW